jgi:hypothetical protein
MHVVTSSGACLGVDGLTQPGQLRAQACRHRHQHNTRPDMEPALSCFRVSV